MYQCYNNHILNLKRSYTSYKIKRKASYLLLLVIVGKNWESSLAPELGTTNNYWFACYPGNIKLSGISFTNL